MTSTLQSDLFFLPQRLNRLLFDFDGLDAGIHRSEQSKPPCVRGQNKVARHRVCPVSVRGHERALPAQSSVTGCTPRIGRGALHTSRALNKVRTPRFWSAMESLDASRPPIAPFLLKLWNILDDPETNHIVRWAPSGSAFEVCDTRAMGISVLPRYFRSSNFGSFQRQLNYFGFRKAGVGANWAHAFFVRSQPELLRQIKRKTRNNAPAAARGTSPAVAGSKWLPNGAGSSESFNHDLAPSSSRVVSGTSVAGTGVGSQHGRESSNAQTSRSWSAVTADAPLPPTDGPEPPTKRYRNDPDLAPVSPITAAVPDMRSLSWASATTDTGNNDAAVMPAKGALLSGALLGFQPVTPADTGDAVSAVVVPAKGALLSGALLNSNPGRASPLRGSNNVATAMPDADYDANAKGSMLCGALLPQPQHQNQRS